MALARKLILLYCTTCSYFHVHVCNFVCTQGKGHLQRRQLLLASQMTNLHILIDTRNFNQELATEDHKSKQTIKRQTNIPQSGDYNLYD